MHNSSAILTSSKTNEWNTPKYIIEDVRRFFGGVITFDPASNYFAQSYIKAAYFYTKREDGLKKPWFGRVFLHPPHGHKNAKKESYGTSAWMYRVHKEYQKQNIIEAIVLGCGDGDGFKLLTSKYVKIECDRIDFLDQFGFKSYSPVPGSTLFYLGKRKDEFVDAFGNYGIATQPYKRVN